jgi:adenylosuccinate synthase
MLFDTSVRVQSIQAGHTVYYKGNAYKMRTIPCAWVDPNVYLVLGPGIFIDRDLLIEEIETINKAIGGGDVRDRLLIDKRAFFVEQSDVDEEINRNIEHGIGSTAHGCGASLVRKLWRDDGKVGQITNDAKWLDENNLNSCICDTISFIQNKTVLLEICQGTMLSVHTSPYYPFVTSREATVVGACAEAGISHRDIFEVIGVARTYPIRVGGNSGDTGTGEISWDRIKENAGYDVVPERTTVTNRVRRIFEWSDTDFVHAVRVNKPDKIILTFVNYLTPCYGATKWGSIDIDSVNKIGQFVKRIERLPASHRYYVSHLGTGEKPSHWIHIDR